METSVDEVCEINLQYTLLLLIHRSDAKSLPKLQNLQYTLLLLIPACYIQYTVAIFHLQYTLLLLIHS